MWNGPGTGHALPRRAEKVIGIDPLYAYQQELVFTRDGGLSIPGILVHDYPTFVLLQRGYR